MVHSLLLGIIQGLTEFLPISSSGHLVIAQEIFGFEGSATLFDALLHFGTLLAVFIALREKIKNLVLGIFKGRKQDLETLGFLALASVPIGFAGFFADSLIESAFKSLTTAGWGLIITGIILLTTLYRPSSVKDIEELSIADAVYIGIAQVLALIPGVSRSGVTISTGLWRKVKGSSSAEFSFLLMIPAVLGATGLSIFKLFQGEFTGQVRPFAFFIGTFAACITGIVSIKWLLSILKKGEFNLFGVYCLLLGSGVLLYTLF